MTDVCPDCQRAERECWPVFRGLPCCEARHLMVLPRKFRREVAQKLRVVSTDDWWSKVRARLDVLIEREAAADALKPPQDAPRKGRTTPSATSASRRAENRGQITA